MSGRDEADPLSPDGIAPAHSHGSVNSRHSTENGKSVDSPAQIVQNTDLSRVELNASHPGTDLDPTLDRVLKHSQRRPALVRSEMIEGMITPARRDQDAVLAGAHEVSARLDSLERSLTYLRRDKTPAHHGSDVSVSVSMARTGEEALVSDQSSCLLFRLPPELRNIIYTYVVYSKYGVPHFQWDEEHNSPKLDLKCAQQRAPSNELLRTCRRIYAESKGTFLEAETLFGSDTTFTLSLPIDSPHTSFGYLECLLDDQVKHMTRVNIDVHAPQLFAVHLRSGPGAAWSVTYPARAPGCSHHSLLPTPLTFVKSVARVRSKSNFRGVVAMLRRWSYSPRIPLCAEHQSESVVLSVPSLSRAGLMAVVAWACGCQSCRIMG